MICIIPARAGSQRIPGKNIKDFHGKPIIAYSIELAHYTGLFDRIVVSTDGVEIAAVAGEYGAEVRQRPSELARDEIGTQEVVGAVLRDLGVDRFTEVCALYSTCPILTGPDLCSAYEFFMLNDNLTCLYSYDVEASEPSGGFYIAIADFFMMGLDPYNAFGSMAWPTNDIDINTPEDWERAEKLYEAIYGTSRPLVE